MTAEPIQTSFRFRPHSEEHENAALGWWAHRIVEAEILTRNIEAVSSPLQYEANLARRLHTREESLRDAITDEWLKASYEGTLNEPVWPKPTVKKHKAMRFAA